MEDEPKDVFEQPAATAVDDAKTKRRERLLANLKKGRETALANRKKKAMFKKAKKQEHEDEMDKVIKQNLKEKDDITELRQEVARLKASKVEPPKVEPAKLKVEPAKVEPPKVEPPQVEPPKVDTPPKQEVDPDRNTLEAIETVPKIKVYSQVTKTPW